MVEDPGRSARQLEIVRKWGKRGCKGTLEAATGFGKSRTGLLGATLLTEKYPVDRNPSWDAAIVVVVPTKALKEEWEDNLAKEGITDAAVYIVNTVVKKGKILCRLLILDEIHAYTGVVFRLVFHVVEYDYILGLTATINEDDERKRIITSRAPIVDVVTMEECLENGWTAPYKVYNLPVYFTEEEQGLYDAYTATFGRGFGMFGNDLDTVFRCMRDKTSAAMQAAVLNMEVGQIIGIAKKTIDAMQNRALILQNASAKIDTTVALCKKFTDGPIITFSHSIDTVDKLHSLMLTESTLYHSKVKGSGELGKHETLKRNLESFKEGKFRILHTAKALDQGVNIPAITTAITLSGTSKQRQATQRAGRATRKTGDKESRIIELYVPGTQEEKWVRAKQRALPRGVVHWVESIDDIQ